MWSRSHPPLVSSGLSSACPSGLESSRNWSQRSRSWSSPMRPAAAASAASDAQEAAVGLVLPGHRTVALPAVAAQQVEAAVVADPGVGVGGHVVDIRVRQGLLGERGPGERRLGVAAYDVLRLRHLPSARRLRGRRGAGSGAGRRSGHGRGSSHSWLDRVMRQRTCRTVQSDRPPNGSGSRSLWLLLRACRSVLGDLVEHLEVGVEGDVPLGAVRRADLDLVGLAAVVAGLGVDDGAATDCGQRGLLGRAPLGGAQRAVVGVGVVVVVGRRRPVVVVGVLASTLGPCRGSRRPRCRRSCGPRPRRPRRGRRWSRRRRPCRHRRPRSRQWRPGRARLRRGRRSRSTPRPRHRSRGLRRLRWWGG